MRTYKFVLSNVFERELITFFLYEICMANQILYINN